MNVCIIFSKICQKATKNTKVTQFRRQRSSEEEAEEQHQATPLLDSAAARLVKKLVKILVEIRVKTS